MKTFANNISMSHRECVYCAAVMLLLYPSVLSALGELTGWVTFLAGFLMLFAAIVITLRDETIFLWDKILFVTISVFSMVAVGITTFVGSIDVIRTMAVILLCVVCLFILATGIAYIVLNKKNWSLPVPYEEVVRYWNSNNLASLSLILAVIHSLQII